MPLTLDQALAMGEDAFAEQEFDDALRYANEALTLDPESLEALDLKASALAELGDYEAADQAFLHLLHREPKNVAWQLAAADVLIRQPGDDRVRVEAGLEMLELAEAGAKKDPQVYTALELLRGLGLNQLGDCEAALSSFDQVLEVDPDNDEARLERAIALFETCQFDHAWKAFLAFSRDFADDPWAFHYLGLIAERRGQPSQPWFEKAERVGGDEFPAPTVLSDKAFAKAVEDAIAELPEHARPHLANAVIDIEALPSDDDLREGELSPSILGVFRGVPIDERSPTDPTHHQTARITLFKKNLERFARSREELLQEIRVTVLHEVGHLLGLDEDELYERGLD